MNDQASSNSSVPKMPITSVNIHSRHIASPTKRANPTPFTWLQPRLWRCPGCSTTLLSREAPPGCPWCGFRGDSEFHFSGGGSPARSCSWALK
jgi:hypothetical protein